MGCSASKLEPEETPPPPVGLGPVQRKIDEFKRNRLMRRRRTTRKDSIVSTTELLIRAEDVDDGLASSDGSLRKPEMSPSMEEETKNKQHNELSGHHQDQEKQKDNVKKEDVKEELQVVTNERGRRLLDDDDDDDEDLPGSPSFRVYFMDDSPSTNEGDQSGAISEKDTLGSKASSEGSENKPPIRKGRARRLREFAAKPISYGIRSCYSNHRSSISLDDKTPLCHCSSELCIGTLTLFPLIS